VALLIAACGGQPSQPDTAAGDAQGSGEPGALGESTVSGRITFEGTAAAPRPVRMDSDPLCMPDGATSELLLVGPDSGLQNVFVYVKDGLGSGTYAPPTTPVELDQKGCRYIPHVFGVQAGQPVHIKNSDPAVHNVNAVAKANDGFNLIQQPNIESTRTFPRPEIMIPLRCDVHPWMNSWAGVVAHPFFAVSQEDGRFEIPRLPAGTYTLEAWHEQLGTRTQTVTVDGQAPAEVSFTFSGAAG
jgi:plastocyanin